MKRRDGQRTRRPKNATAEEREPRPLLRPILGRARKIGVNVGSSVVPPFPIGAAKSIYAKPTKNANGELDIKQNYARVGSDEIDQLFQQANEELDRKKAIEIANRIDALIWQEVHSLTSYQRPEIFVCKKNLANFGAFGFADIIYTDIGWARP